MSADQLFSNNAKCKFGAALVTTGVNNVTATVELEAGKGSLFKSPSGNQFQLLTFKEGDIVEIVKMTARTGDSITVTRAQEGTAAQDFTTAGDIFATITEATFQDINDKVVQNTAKAVQNNDNSGDAIGTASINIQSGRTVPANVASGDYAVTIGYDTIAALNSIVFGKAAKGNALDAIAIGRDTDAKQQSICIGRNAHSLDGDCVSIGANTEAAAYDSIVIGQWAKTTDQANSYGDIAIGAYAEAHGSSDLYTIMIGADMVNRIGQTHVIGGPALVKKDVGESVAIAFRQYASQENLLFSKEIDLTQTAADDVAVLNLPAGASFYPDECGLVITASDTVTAQPQVSFGIAGDSTALLVQTAVSISALKSRQRFTSLASGDGQVSLTASLKVAATATSLKGRFYFKGILIEDQ